MLKKIVGFVWRRLPNKLGKKIIRAGQSKFSVSSGGIITDDRGKILLLNHVFRAGSGWGVPGGFINHGEQPEVALQRELREEIGLKLKNVKVFSVQTIGKHIEILLTAEADGEIKLKSFEINKAEWFAVEELPDGMSNSQKAAIRKIIKEEG